MTGQLCPREAARKLRLGDGIALLKQASGNRPETQLHLAKRPGPAKPLAVLPATPESKARHAKAAGLIAAGAAEDKVQEQLRAVQSLMAREVREARRLRASTAVIVFTAGLGTGITLTALLLIR